MLWFTRNSHNEMLEIISGCRETVLSFLLEDPENDLVIGIPCVNFDNRFHILSNGNLEKFLDEFPFSKYSLDKNKFFYESIPLNSFKKRLASECYTFQFCAKNDKIEYIKMSPPELNGSLEDYLKLALFSFEMLIIREMLDSIAIHGKYNPDIEDRPLIKESLFAYNFVKHVVDQELCQDLFNHNSCNGAEDCLGIINMASFIAFKLDYDIDPVTGLRICKELPYTYSDYYSPQIHPSFLNNI